MSQFELVEDYLTNRLDDGGKRAFEQQMETDPLLKAEVNLQKEIIEGVKSARAAELKSMLNNVPIGGAPSALVGKVVLGTISAGIIGTALYFSLNTSTTESTPLNQPEQSIEQPVTPEQETITETPTETVEQNIAEENNKPTKAPEKKKTEQKSVAPKIEVMDPTSDLDSNSESGVAPNAGDKPSVSAHGVEVELDSSNKTYSFHYQFSHDKLVLYGPFDASLYEVIEINGDIHSLFLFYKKSYYRLDENEHNVVPLIMIRDKVLLEKLEKYRNKN